MPFAPSRCLATLSALFLGAVAIAQPTAGPAEATAAHARAEALLHDALKILTSEGDAAKAAATLRASAEADPSFAAPRRNLARLAEAANDWDTAIKWQAEVVRLSHGDQARQAEDALARLTARQTEWATPEGRQRISYEQAVARGQILVRAERFLDAQAEAEAAIALDAKRYEAYALLANAHLRAGREAEALEALAAAAERAGQTFAAQQLSTLRWSLDAKVRAASLLRQAREKRQAGANDEAVALLQKAFEQNSDLTALHLEVAAELVALDRGELALPIYEYVATWGTPGEVTRAKRRMSELQDRLAEAKAVADRDQGRATADRERAAGRAAYERMAREMRQKAQLLFEAEDFARQAQAAAAASSPNEAEVAALWRKSAERGHAEAAFRIGLAYHEGRGVAKNAASAAAWWQKAVERGNAEAVPYLAFAYHEGRGIAVNDAKALELWQKAAPRGDARSAYELGNAYAEGRLIARNDAAAVKWWRQAAEAEIHGAMFRLGQAYQYGRGVAASLPTAVEWYDRAGDAAVTDAATIKLLADAFSSGKSGVAQDPVKAAKWRLAAAKKGDVESMFLVGCAYYEGQGIEYDRAQAVAWWKKAASSGHTTATVLVGAAYATGGGVDQDHATAVSWYRRAADRGDARAMNEIGNAYWEGNGVTQSHATACSWFQKAASAGNVDAMMALASSYQSGDGVKKSMPDAIYWWRKAARLNNESAISELNYRKLSW